MRTAYTAAQIRAAEAPLLARGVPLMVRASQSLAEHVVSLLPVPAEARILVLAGAGDNGGDALFAAASIADAGATVAIVPAMGRMHEAALAAALASGAKVVELPEGDITEAVAACVHECEVIVDGVLGIGAGGAAVGGSPALRGRAREVIVAAKLAIASTPHPRPLVVAVDIPSGIDPDSGEVAEPDAVLKADLTVTFIGIKAGLVTEPGASFAGKVWLEPIGASHALLGVTPAVTLP